MQKKKSQFLNVILKWLNSYISSQVAIIHPKNDGLVNLMQVIQASCLGLSKMHKKKKIKKSGMQKGVKLSLCSLSCHIILCKTLLTQQLAVTSQGQNKTQN